MAGLKEIKRRLKSVKNTKKITYAMKLVSAAKLRKAQDSVTQSRAYSESVSDVLKDLSAERDSSHFAHPLLQPHEQVRVVRYLVIGGSRGLCAGYNSNLNRMADALAKQENAARPGVRLEFVLIGKKVGEYFRREKRSYLKAYEQLPEDPYLWPVEEIASSLEQDFYEGRIDEAHLVYTRFKSALAVRPTHEKLLPLEQAAVDAETEAWGGGAPRE